jgi:hypothetical protein
MECFLGIYFVLVLKKVFLLHWAKGLFYPVKKLFFVSEKEYFPGKLLRNLPCLTGLFFLVIPSSYFSFSCAAVSYFADPAG